ncbi:MAG: hypothetical protein R2877_04650 [Bdellovibrionota bacterium]
MKDVIVNRHFESMKDGALVCNTGHYDCEINIPQLKDLTEKVTTIRENNRNTFRKRSPHLRVGRRSSDQPSRCR